MGYFNNSEVNFGIDDTNEVGEKLFGQDEPVFFVAMVKSLDDKETKALVNELYETEWLVPDEEKKTEDKKD